MTRHIRLPLKVLALFAVACLGLVVLALLVTGWLRPLVGLALNVLIQVLFGWVLFIARVAGEVRVEPMALLTGAACLVLLIVTIHIMGRVLDPTNGHWPWRWTLAAVSLVAVLFASGLGAVGIYESLGRLVLAADPFLRDGIR